MRVIRTDDCGMGRHEGASLCEKLFSTEYWERARGSSTSSPAQAQAVNDTVTPKEPIDLKIKDRVIATVKPKDVLTVEKVQEDWLWVVTAKNEHGWLMKGDVEPIKLPAAGLGNTKPKPSARMNRGPSRPSTNACI